MDAVIERDERSQHTRRFKGCGYIFFYSGKYRDHSFSCLFMFNILFNRHSATHLNFLKSDVEIKIEIQIFHVASRAGMHAQA